MPKTHQNQPYNKILKPLRYLMKMDDKYKNQILKKISKKFKQSNKTQIDVKDNLFLVNFMISKYFKKRLKNREKKMNIIKSINELSLHSIKIQFVTKSVHVFGITEQFLFNFLRFINSLWFNIKSFYFKFVNFRYIIEFIWTLVDQIS